MAERAACLAAIRRAVAPTVVLAIFSLLASAMAAPAAPGVIVTDVRGEARLGDGRTVQLLAEMPVAAEVQLQPAAHLTMIHLGSQSVFELVGPGRYAIRAEGVETLAGTRPAAAKALAPSYRGVR